MATVFGQLKLRGTRKHNILETILNYLSINILNNKRKCFSLKAFYCSSWNQVSVFALIARRMRKVALIMLSDLIKSEIRAAAAPIETSK